MCFLVSTLNWVYLVSFVVIFVGLYAIPFHKFSSYFMFIFIIITTTTIIIIINNMNLLFALPP